MAQFRTVTDDFSVSPQISVADVEAAAEDGFALIVNNRPDGEAPEQPTGAGIEAAATAAGIEYAHVPVVGRPTAAQAAVMHAAIARAGGKTLAYCRSGTRSITAWAVGQAAAGERSREELIRLGRAAGYDLSAVL